MKAILLAVVVLPAALLAQGAAPPSAPPPPRPAAPAPALPGPPIRKVESATHVSTELFGAINGVRQLADGRVLINDGTRRRLVIMDSTLKSVKVVLDSATDTENAYGTALGGIIPYLGDSTLFIDRASYAMLLLDGNGKVVRVRAVPTTSYLSNLTSGNTIPGVDASGRLVLRIQAKAAPRPADLPASMPYFAAPPDSALIVRMDLNTRKLDTAGVIHIPKSPLLTVLRPDGAYVSRTMLNPLPSTDEWAVLSDGTIAYIRGRDYRLEWEDDHNTLTSSAKLPFDWVHLSDDDKRRMSDSVKKSQADLLANAYYFQMLSWVNRFAQPYPADFKMPAGLVFPPGMPGNWLLPPGFSLPEGYERGPAQPAPSSLPGAKIPAAPVPGTTAEIAVASVLPTEEWPDYKPPFGVGAARADGDGNLWVAINIMHPIPGGVIYDVINRKGELADRIQLPAGHALVGFGAGHVIYLSFREGTAYHLERVRLKY